MADYFVGTYTTGTASRGIYRVTLQQDRLTGGSCVIAMRDPSYLAGQGGVLYAVSEDLTPETEGQVFRFLRCPDGSFQKTAAAGSLGISPCHAALSPDGRELLLCNYTSGSAVRYRAEDLSRLDIVHGSQKSIHPLRQTGSHAHQATPFRNGWLICDLGGDCLWHWTAEDCRERAYPLPAGCGPRHLVIVGTLAYIGCELSNELLTLDLETGTLLNRQTTLEDSRRESAVAAVRYADGAVYVSNRGADSVSVFSLEAPARPRRIGVWPTGWENPRDILVRPDGILCACAQGVTWLKKREDGSYCLTDRLALPGAVALLEEK